MCGIMSGADEEVNVCGGEEEWVGEEGDSSPGELTLLMAEEGAVFFLLKAGGGGRLNLGGCPGFMGAGLVGLGALTPGSSCLSSLTRTESSPPSSSSSLPPE